MNCAEKLLEPTIFFNLYTKSPQKSGSESPLRRRDLTPTWVVSSIKFRKGFAKFMIQIALLNPRLVVFGSLDPLPSTTRKKMSWTPSDKTFWIRA